MKSVPRPDSQSQDPSHPAPATPIEAQLESGPSSTAFMPYPTSRLAPRIVPQDLTSFKSRGISRVERELQQELVELRDRYLAVIDAFNWNKLIYESHIGFEPVVGETYHLYDIRNAYHLSMISPQEWHQKWIGSFRLNADGRWQSIELTDEFDLRSMVGEADHAL